MGFDNFRTQVAQEGERLILEDVASGQLVNWNKRGIKTAKGLATCFVVDMVLHRYDEEIQEYFSREGNYIPTHVKECARNVVNLFESREKIKRVA